MTGSGPLAVCVGGPRDRWVYHDRDLETQRSAADAMGYPHDYLPTVEMRPWPLDPGIECRVWRWTGAEPEPAPAPKPPRRKRPRP